MKKNPKKNLTKYVAGAMAVALVLTATPVFAAKKQKEAKNKNDRKESIVDVLESVISAHVSAPTAEAATTSNNDDGDTAAAASSTTTTPPQSTVKETPASTTSSKPAATQKDPDPAPVPVIPPVVTVPAATTTPTTEAEDAPATTTVPAKPTPTSTKPTTTPAVVTTKPAATSTSPFMGTTGAFAFNSNDGGPTRSVYTSGALSATETRNLVALALMLAAAGVLLSFGRVPIRTQSGRRVTLPMGARPTQSRA